MPFTSLEFLLFAAVLLIFYYVIPGKYQWMLLLMASCVFYLSAGIEYLVFILFTTLTVYAAARIIGIKLQKQDEYLNEYKQELSREYRKEYKDRVKKANRFCLIMCLAANFLILALCKALLVEPFRSLAHGGELSFLTMALPLGISFYMFQSAGYLIDVYRGRVKAEKNLFRFALFVSFFPQLVQGPISSYSKLAPSLYEPHSFDGKRLSFGMQRMLWGYFKKLVVADRIAPAVIALREPEYMGAGFILISIFYAVQIYCDFTGGIDIAIGMGETLGIVMPENFIRPFFSKNIAEYWRRWHITLGEWMKNYIFYPVSLSQPMLKLAKFARSKLGDFGKRLPVYIASVATWFVTGIWHGLAPNFVLWGMLNCFVIVVSEELQPLYQKFHKRFRLKEKKWYGWFEMLRMFFLMNIIRACDLFPNVGDYFARIGSLFTDWSFSGSLANLGLSSLDYIIIGLSIVLIFTVSVIQEKKGSVRELLWKKPIWVRYALNYALLVAVLLAGKYGLGYSSGNFIYNQF